MTPTQPTTDWRDAVHLKGILDGLISLAMTEATPQRISDAEVAQGPKVRAAGEPSEIPTGGRHL